MARRFSCTGDALISPHAQVNNTTTIESPRPRRVLKRSILDVDLDTESSSSKRLCQSRQLPPQLPIFESTSLLGHPFLSEPVCLTCPLVRSRSDSFLITMCSRPHRNIRVPKRYADEPYQPKAKRGSNGDALTPPSASVSPFSSITYRHETATPVTSASTSTSVYSGSYRANLKANNIFIEPPWPKRPAAVVQYASEILDRKRESPGLTDDDAKVASELMCGIQQWADEGVIGQTLHDLDIIPSVTRLPTGVIQGSSLPFTKTLPKSPTMPTLPQQKPDHHYAYEQDIYSYEQILKQSHRHLQHHSKPSSTGYWPFFTIEFKSQAKGGTMWVAENQAVTASAQLVYSVEELLSLSEQQFEQIDSICFSCTIDAKYAGIWVSYCEQYEGQRRLYSFEVRRYLLGEKDHIIACRNTIRNILDWGIKDRLPKLVKALDSIKSEDLDAHEKAQLVRAATDDDENKAHKRVRH